MTIPEILEQLEYHTGIFPHEALQEAILQKDEIIPELLRFLEYTVANAEELTKSKKEYWGHIFAMYLLAQFREKRAFPLIIKLMQFPEKLIDHLLDDIITEDLNSILASVYNGDILSIKNIIEDDNIYEFTRHAAIASLNILVYNNILNRDDIIKYYSELFRGKLSRENNYIWVSLVRYSRDLYAKELIDDIKKAYADNLIDNFNIKLESILRTLNSEHTSFLENENLKYKRMGLVDDAIRYLKRWQWKKPEELDDPPISIQKIGRNESCPCGSGKKYKKCCRKN